MKTKFNGFLTLLLALLVQITFAQEKTVTGVVSDASGPLPGVTVIIVGTTVGTLTDFDGNYSISAEPGAVLQFSFVGMLSVDRTIGDSNVINLVMQEDATVLEEVVVTALGISRVERGLGYNVQSIDAETIGPKPNADIVNTLSGTTSGVSVVSSSGDAGSSARIVIRGAASMTGDNQPLFVVNGMPIITGSALITAGQDVGGVVTSNRSIDLNPDDIESLSVLKGGAATALYGVRAANGAIIITTKSGKNLTERRVEFSSSVSIDVISQVPELQTKWAQGAKGEWISGQSDAYGPKISELEYDGDTDYKWDPLGRLVPKGTGNGTAAKVYDPYKFFQQGITNNNRFSVSNGNDSGNFYFSMSNLEQEGIIPNNEYGRTTTRLTGSTNISDKITLNADMGYTNSRADQKQKGSQASGIMLGLLRTPPTFDNSAGYEFPDGSQRTFSHGGVYDNPYWIANNINFAEGINRFTGSLNLNIEFSDFFSITYNVGSDWYNRRYQNRFKIGSNDKTAGYLDEYQAYDSTFNSDLILKFDKDINENFNAKLALGNNFNSEYYKELYSEADGLEIPDFYQLSNSANTSTTSGIVNSRTMAVYADLQLNYQNMLYLSLTGRNDWATSMPVANESAFYPSASLGFVFTELEGLKGDVFTFGKLRASLARTANISGPYNTSNYFEAATAGDGWTQDAAGKSVSFPYQGQTSFLLQTGLGNPDLKHETMDSWEIGADLRFFQNRFGLDLTYFNNNNKDLLMSVPISASSGFGSVFLNAASMISKGVEVSVNAAPIQSEDFNWNVLANFTKITNTVTELADGVENIFLGGFTQPQIRAVAGEEYKSIYGFDWTRDSNGTVLINDDPSDNNRDGYPWNNNPQGLVSLGKVNPDWTANITNTLQYKNLSLSFLFDFQAGGFMYNGTVNTMNSLGTSKRTENREVYYTPEGTIDFDLTPAENIVVMDGVYGHLDGDGNVVSSNVTNVTPVVLDEDWFEGHGGNFGGGPEFTALEPTDWIRLRNVTISYDLPQISKHIKSAQIYFSGKNLWLSTPYTGIDPETSLTGASNAQGMDYFNSPGSKTYLMGVKISL